MRGKLCYKTEFEDGSVSFSKAFDPDDPSLIDRHPEYDTDTHLGHRSPTPTQQRNDTGADPGGGGGHPARAPLKLEKNRFFGVKS
jgi:hypothetical protein